MDSAMNFKYIVAHFISGTTEECEWTEGVRWKGTHVWVGDWHLQRSGCHKPVSQDSPERLSAR